jgi:6-phosphogluconate dehydrogenase (decarboxylating)
MQVGMVGLGRMGANIVRRLMRGGHECVVFDVNPESVTALAAEGATGAESLADLASKRPMTTRTRRLRRQSRGQMARVETTPRRSR